MTRRYSIDVTVYMPANPSNVNNTLPPDKSGDDPSEILSKLKISHGCRPSSVVSQPAVLAMNGNGVARRSSHNAHRLAHNLRCHSKNAATSIRAMNSVPSPTIIW